MNGDNRWADTQRLEGWAGEVRINLFRLAAVLAFYGHHLINVYVIDDDPSRKGDYHAAVTLVVLAWTLLILGLYWCLKRRWVPPTLKYAATAADLVLITALLVIGADAKTTLTDLYFLVIAAAALRLDLPLVYTATLTAMICYASFLGYVKWVLELPDAQRPSRPQQLIALLALGAAGILAGQVVRQARRLVDGQVLIVEDAVEESA